MRLAIFLFLRPGQVHPAELLPGLGNQEAAWSELCCPQVSGRVYFLGRIIIIIFDKMISIFILRLWTDVTWTRWQQPTLPWCLVQTLPGQMTRLCHSHLSGQSMLSLSISSQTCTRSSSSRERTKRSLRYNSMWLITQGRIYSMFRNNKTAILGRIFRCHSIRVQTLFS